MKLLFWSKQNPRGHIQILGPDTGSEYRKFLGIESVLVNLPRFQMRLVWYL